MEVAAFVAPVLRELEVSGSGIDAGHHVAPATHVGELATAPSGTHLPAIAVAQANERRRVGIMCAAVARSPRSVGYGRWHAFHIALDDGV